MNNSADKATNKSKKEGKKVPLNDLYISAYAELEIKGWSQSMVGFEVSVVEAINIFTRLVKKYGSLGQLAHHLFNRIQWVRDAAVDRGWYGLQTFCGYDLASNHKHSEQINQQRASVLQSLFTEADVLDALKAMRTPFSYAVNGQVGDHSGLFQKSAINHTDLVPASIRELDFIDDELKLLFAWVIPRIPLASDYVFKSLIVNYPLLKCRQEMLPHLFLVNTLWCCPLSKYVKVDTYFVAHKIGFHVYTRLLNIILAPENAPVTARDDAIQFVHWLFLSRDFFAQITKAGQLIKNTAFAEALGASNYELIDLLRATWFCPYLSVSTKKGKLFEYCNLFLSSDFIVAMHTWVRQHGIDNPGWNELDSVWLDILYSKMRKHGGLSAYLLGTNLRSRKMLLTWFGDGLGKLLRLCVCTLSSQPDDMGVINKELEHFMFFTYESQPIRLAVGSHKNMELLIQLVLETDRRAVKLNSLGILANLSLEGRVRRRIMRYLPLNNILNYVQRDFDDLMFRAYAAELLAGMTRSPDFCRLMLANKSFGCHVIIATLVVLRHSSNDDDAETVKFLEKSVQNIKKTPVSSQSILGAAAEQDGEGTIAEVKNSI